MQDARLGAAAALRARGASRACVHHSLRHTVRPAHSFCVRAADSLCRRLSARASCQEHAAPPPPRRPDCARRPPGAIIIWPIGRATNSGPPVSAGDKQAAADHHEWPARGRAEWAALAAFMAQLGRPISFLPRSLASPACRNLASSSSESPLAAQSPAASTREPPRRPLCACLRGAPQLAKPPGGRALSPGGGGSRVQPLA